MRLHCYDVLSIVQKVQDDTKMAPKPKRSRSVVKTPDKYTSGPLLAIGYTLAHDDGITLASLEEADIILLGVSQLVKRQRACCSNAVWFARHRLQHRLSMMILLA